MNRKSSFLKIHFLVCLKQKLITLTVSNLGKDMEVKGEQEHSTISQSQYSMINCKAINLIKINKFNLSNKIRT